MKQAISRRSFLKTGSAFAGVTILPRSVFGANSANARVNYAIVGAGGMGATAVKECAHMGNLVALCDVDEARAAKVFSAHPEVPRFKDFRVMLDKLGDQIDAVAISIPDHAHHVVTRTCMLQGKHVYTQKPLCNYISQVRDLMELERKAGVVTQMGNQGRSSHAIHNVKAWYDAGAFGTVTDVYAWTNRPIWPQGMQEHPPEMPVPETLDWDLWQAGVAERPYNSAYLPFKWRGWKDYGAGALGDIAVHAMDASFFALEYTWPTRIEMVSIKGESEVAFPKETQVVYHFPAKGKRPAVKFHWYDGAGNRPPRPEGLAEGKNMGPQIGGQYWTGTRSTLLGGVYADGARILPEEKRQEIMPDMPSTDRPSGHFKNWDLAIKGVEKARSHFPYSGTMTEIVLLGTIAQRVGKTLELDPVNKRILNSPEAEALMQAPPPRRGWE